MQITHFTHMLLTELEKENISKWKYNATDNSLTTPYLRNYWNYLQTLFPNYVAPNVITLFGLLSVLYGFYITLNFHDFNPHLMEILALVSLFIYSTLDAIDGIHARKTKNSSPVGELLDHTVDSISTVFIVLMFTKIFGINNTDTIWYGVHFATLGFHFFHVLAMKTKNVTFSKFFGPNEIMSYLAILTFLKMFGVLPSLITVCDFSFPLIYYLTLAVSFGFALLELRKIDKDSSNGLMIIYGMLFLKSLFIRYIPNNIFTIIADGVAISSVSTDLMVCKWVKNH